MRYRVLAWQKPSAMILIKCGLITQEGHVEIEVKAVPG